jgi:hypothetical protein
MFKTLRVMLKNLILIRHFGTNHHFSQIFLIRVAYKNEISLQRTRTQKKWKIPKVSFIEFRPPSWTSDIILNLTKNVSFVKYFRLK